MYCNSLHWDIKTNSSNCCKNGTVWFYSVVIRPKDVHVDGMANSIDPDQTTSKRSSLTWVLTVCSDLSFPLRNWHVNWPDRTGISL